VVVCAQAFHWFDHAQALPEIARVLRPGGVLAVVWNERDESVPWVRRLGRLIGPENHDSVGAVRESPLFEDLDQEDFRIWQKLDRDGLTDLVRSRSAVAVLDEPERLERLARAQELYDDYGRGHDGMLLPYLTRCYRAVVRHPPEPPARRPGDEATALETTGSEEREPAEPGDPPEPREPPEDPGTLLIDFR
jgi:SAM-dependent methyltransferase